MTDEHAAVGLTHKGEAGRYDRPLRAGTWAVPRVELTEGEEKLAWTLHDPDGSWVAGSTDGRDRLLERFMRLRGAPAAKVAAYASEMGVLTGCSPWHETAGEEPLEWWRTLATEARAVIDVAAVIRGGRRPVSTSDWAPFVTMSVSAADEWWEFDFLNYGPLQLMEHDAGSGLLDAKQLLAAYVGRWLSAVRLSVAWSYRREAEFLLKPLGLLGALGVQLAQDLARTDGLATCRGCAQPYAQSHGLQRYCPECRDLKEGARRNSKAYRERLRS